jgi:hypothetical protein
MAVPFNQVKLGHGILIVEWVMDSITTGVPITVGYYNEFTIQVDWSGSPTSEEWDLEGSNYTEDETAVWTTLRDSTETKIDESNGLFDATTGEGIATGLSMPNLIRPNVVGLGGQTSVTFRLVCRTVARG